MLSTTSLLSGGAHTLLDHESVHVDVGLQAATIRGVCQTVVLERLFNLERLLLLSQHFMKALYFAALQLELLFNGFNPALVLSKQGVKLVRVHLSHSTVVVRHVRVDATVSALSFTT